MKIVEFLEAVEAQIVGGRVKALIDGVHHFVAEMVEGSPVLTAAGQAAKEELETKAPAIVQEVTNAPAAVAEVVTLATDPTLLAGVATGGVGGVAQAVVKGAAEKAAVEGVDALLDGITAKVAPKSKAAKATS